MNAEILNISLAEYLAIEAESSGRVNDYLTSPALYEAKHITHSINEKSTDPMLLGSAIHCRLLERDEYESRYAVGPTNDRRTKKWTEFEAEHPDHECITPSMASTIGAVARAVEQHEEAAALLECEDGESEVTVVWTDEKTGLRCKARFDRRRAAKLWAIELKSTLSVRPDELSRTAYSGGWHRRSAFYSEAHRQAWGESPHAFLWIACATAAPFEVRVFTLDTIAEDQGAQDVRSALDGIAEMRESKVWRAPWQCGVTTLSLPVWAMRRDAEEAAQ